MFGWLCVLLLLGACVIVLFMICLIVCHYHVCCLCLLSVVTSMFVLYVCCPQFVCLFVVINNVWLLVVYCDQRGPLRAVPPLQQLGLRQDTLLCYTLDYRNKLYHIMVVILHHIIRLYQATLYHSMV